MILQKNYAKPKSNQFQFQIQSIPNLRLELVLSCSEKMSVSIDEEKESLSNIIKSALYIFADNISNDHK